VNVGFGEINRVIANYIEGQQWAMNAKGVPNPNW